MKYKSNITKEIKITISVLLLYWLFSVLISLKNNGIGDIAIMSVFILGFSVIFISAFVNGTYLVIENNSVTYVLMYVLKEKAEISKLQKIQKGSIGGVFKSLLLTYEDNGEVKDIKISLISFKKDTLKKIVSDLKMKSPHINVDESANELM